MIIISTKCLETGPGNFMGFYYCVKFVFLSSRKFLILHKYDWGRLFNFSHVCMVIDIYNVQLKYRNFIQLWMNPCPVPPAIPLATAPGPALPPVTLCVTCTPVEIRFNILTDGWDILVRVKWVHMAGIAQEEASFKWDRFTQFRLKKCPRRRLSGGCINYGLIWS